MSALLPQPEGIEDLENYWRAYATAVERERDDLRAQVERQQWQPIETAPCGERILLCWDAASGVKAHVELGKRSPSDIYTNTYGRPFSGTPDRWMQLPSTECTCGGDPQQPADHHDLTCPLTLTPHNSEAGNV